MELLGVKPGRVSGFTPKLAVAPQTGVLAKLVALGDGG